MPKYTPLRVYGNANNRCGDIVNTPQSYTTTPADGSFSHFVELRGLAHQWGAGARSVFSDVVKRYWDALLTPELKATLKEPFSSVPLPVGTAFSIALGEPQCDNWVKVTLQGETMDAAFTDIITYLGTYGFGPTMTGTDILTHLLNADLRAKNHIGDVTAATLKQSISGDAYVQARPKDPVASIPAAINHPGIVKTESWQEDLRAYLDGADHAIASVDSTATMLDGDLNEVVDLIGGLRLLFDLAYLAYYRPHGVGSTAVPSAPIPRPALARFATDCMTDVILASLPGGSAQYAWNLLSTASWAELDKRYKSDAKVTPYKALAAKFAMSPYTVTELVERACDTEAHVMELIAARGDPGAGLIDQLRSAVDWLGQITQGSTPPPAAGGMGVLLGMFGAVDPKAASATSVFPPGLWRFRHYVMTEYARLSNPKEAGRDLRIKQAMATALGLDGNEKSSFLQPDVVLPSTPHTGWGYLLSVEGPLGPSMIKKETAGMIRIIQATTAPFEIIAKANKAVVPSLVVGGDAAVAWCRGIAFLSIGINLADKALQTGQAAFNADGSFGSNVEGLLKYGESAFGSYLRDYLSMETMLQTNLPYATRKAAIEAIDKSVYLPLQPGRVGGRAITRKALGNALGVVAGLWTAKDGFMQRNNVLAAAGLIGALGYGLRFFGPWAAKFGSPVTIAVSVGLEIWDANKPKPPSERLKPFMLGLLEDLRKRVHNWYNRAQSHGDYPAPWRATAAPAVASALTALDALAKDCEDKTSWKNLDPCSEDDMHAVRKRLVAIGFTEHDAQAIVPDEGVGRWGFLRGSAPAMPQTWPTFEEQTAAP